MIHVDNDDDRNLSIRIKAISTHDGPKHTYMDCNYLSVCLSVSLSLSHSPSVLDPSVGHTHYKPLAAIPVDVRLP